MSEPLRVLVADDSAFIRNLIASYLDAEPEFTVVGTAENGLQAVQAVRDLRPDVVTLDVDMPVMSGLEALDRIMQDVPTPIVMVSGVSRHAAATTLDAINAGAVDFILKYVPGQQVSAEEIRLDMISKLRAAAGVRVVRTIVSRVSQAKRSGTGSPSKTIAAARFGDASLRGTELSPAVSLTGASANPNVSVMPTDLVVIGASTGGPLAVKELLRGLPTDFAAPIIVVQHIPAHFTEVLAAQLNSQTAFRADVVKGGETLRSRHVYIAPADAHLLLSPSMYLQLHDGPAICGHRPSIDVTMKSIAQSFPNGLHGVLLTGMGIDGASGLAYIRSRGGTTYAQDAESCVVFGMPKQAILLNAVDHVASPQGIAERLTVQTGKHVAARHRSFEAISLEGTSARPSVPFQ